MLRVRASENRAESQLAAARFPPSSCECAAGMGVGAALRRCVECGYVESRQANQYTVRMVDGSTRVFTEDPSVSWRVGERLIVID